MESFDLIVVGGGMAGLSSATFLSLEGLRFDCGNDLDARPRAMSI